MKRTACVLIFAALTAGSLLAPAKCRAAEEWTLFVPGLELPENWIGERKAPDGYSAEGVTEIADLADLREGRVGEMEPYGSQGDEALTLGDDERDDGRKVAREYMKGGKGEDLDKPIKKSMANLPMRFPYAELDSLPAPWNLAGVEDAAWSLQFSGLYSLIVRKGRIWVEPEGGGAEVPQVAERVWLGGEAIFTFTRSADGKERRYGYKDLSGDELEPGNFPMGTTRREIEKDLDKWLLSRLSDSLNDLIETEAADKP